jgi:hypothetical protein
MGKTNWKRVFLGGVVAGVVSLVLGTAAETIFLQKLWSPVLEALGHPLPQTIGMGIFWIIFVLVGGIVSIWLYSAIRPRYGAGPKTAVIAGLGYWIIGIFYPNLLQGSMGVYPAKVLVIDSLTYLVVLVVATLVGAWVYKEQG